MGGNDGGAGRLAPTYDVVGQMAVARGGAGQMAAVVMWSAHRLLAVSKRLGLGPQAELCPNISP